MHIQADYLMKIPNFIVCNLHEKRILKLSRRSFHQQHRQIYDVHLQSSWTNRSGKSFCCVCIACLPKNHLNEQTIRGTQTPNTRSEKMNDESDDSELWISVCFHLHFELSLSFRERRPFITRAFHVNSLRRFDSSMLKANNKNKIVLKTLSTKSFRFSRRLNV